MPKSPFRVAVTADAVRPDGSSVHGDLQLQRLTEQDIDWFVLPGYVDPIPAEWLDGVNAVYSLGHTRFGEATLAGVPDLQLIARFGAGYETIDVPACTRAGVAVTNTPDAVRRPLALAAITLLLALAHNLIPKDRLTRTSKWEERGAYRGAAIDGMTVGIVGFGSVGAEIARMLLPMGLRVIGNNRSGVSPAAGELGIQLLELNDLLQEADYVVLCASLTPETVGLLGREQLAAMRPGSFLINVGRGQLVDTEALKDALRTGHLAGAGLDVFDPEPLAPDDELLGLDNVVLSPHSLCWTADFTRSVSESALGSILAVARGENPVAALNPEVFETRAWKAKAALIRGRGNFPTGVIL